MLVDAGLGGINEIRREWHIGQYLDAHEFLAVKAHEERKAMEAQKGRQK